MLDLASTFLGFARDFEASSRVLVEDLDSIRIQTEAPLEFWDKIMTWIGNTGHFDDPFVPQWNCPRIGKNNPQSPP